MCLPEADGALTFRSPCPARGTSGPSTRASKVIPSPISTPSVTMIPPLLATAPKAPVQRESYPPPASSRPGPGVLPTGDSALAGPLSIGSTRHVGWGRPLRYRLGPIHRRPGLHSSKRAPAGTSALDSRRGLRLIGCRRSRWLRAQARSHGPGSSSALSTATRASCGVNCTASAGYVPPATDISASGDCSFTFTCANYVAPGKPLVGIPIRCRALERACYRQSPVPYLRTPPRQGTNDSDSCPCPPTRSTFRHFPWLGDQDAT